MAHSIEPELRGPRPRQVRRRPGHGRFFGFLQIFILPHALVGLAFVVGALWVTLRTVLLWTIGTEVIARVVKVESVRGKGATDRVTYSYSLEGKEYVERDSIRGQVAPRLEPGSPLPVRVVAWLPGGATVRNSWTHHAGAAAAIGLGGLFWNGIVAVFLWDAYIRPLTARWLVIWGTPVVATVVRKAAKGGKGGPFYQVEYRFEPALGGSSRTAAVVGRMQVQRAGWDAVAEGDAATVLHHERRPRRSVLYCCSDYQAVL